MVANHCPFGNFWHIALISQKHVGIFSSSIQSKYFLRISFGKIGWIRSGTFLIVGNFHTEKSFHYYFFILRFMPKICRQFFQIYWNACLIFFFVDLCQKSAGMRRRASTRTPSTPGNTTSIQFLTITTSVKGSSSM